MLENISLHLIPTLGLLCLGAILSYLILLIMSQIRQMATLERFQKRQLNDLLERSQRRLANIDLEQLDKRGAWRGLRKFEVQRMEIEDAAQSICSFYLIPHDRRPLRAFRPGQFLTFHLDIPEHKDTVRCYSLSHAAEQNDYFRVSIKKIPAPKAQPELPPGLSSNFFHELSPGSSLSIEAPSGDFYLDTQSQQPVVLIGGGIGLTPVYSMLEHIAAHNPERETWFFYGIRNGKEHIWKEQLRQIGQNPNIHIVICYSNPDEKDQLGHDYDIKGRVNVALIKEQLEQRGNNYQFYLCGPPPMMRSLISDLADWNVAEEQIHYEAFGPASIIKEEKTSTSKVQNYLIEFSQSGQSYTWDGSDENLWSFAQKNGLVLPKGCGAGNCGQCKTFIREGQVNYPRKPSKRIEKNACLICCAVPSSDLKLEA